MKCHSDIIGLQGPPSEIKFHPLVCIAVEAIISTGPSGPVEQPCSACLHSSVMQAHLLTMQRNPCCQSPPVLASKS